MVEVDIKGFFDNIDHDLLLKAVRHHTQERWVMMYIERWLKAPVQMPDGAMLARDRGNAAGRRDLTPAFKSVPALCL